ncbi:MAG: hypothetical protein JO020_28440 [Chloroflexi bacterium]|nr:hypothetical protein [Chloroflexota bacterium]
MAVAMFLFTGAPEQSGYLTAAPVPDWLGLATAGGRDAIVLGDACDVAAPGVNVVIVDSDHVQVVDPLAGPLPGVCSVTRRMHMSDVPCARNPAGLCDVAFE